MLKEDAAGVLAPSDGRTTDLMGDGKEPLLTPTFPGTGRFPDPA